jgi:hypothetical protein
MRSGDRPGLQKHLAELLAFVFNGLSWCCCCTIGAVWHPLSLNVQCIVQQGARRHGLLLALMVLVSRRVVR